MKYTVFTFIFFFTLGPNNSFGKNLSIDANAGCQGKAVNNPSFTELLTLVKKITNKPPCGLSGSVKKRIKDCSNFDYNAGRFVLVARTKEGYEVYKDIQSQLLWSGALPSKMNHNDAVKACSSLSSNFKEIGLGFSWSLPRDGQFRMASLERWSKDLESTLFWTLTKTDSPPYDWMRTYKYFQEGRNDAWKWDARDKSAKLSVRCVSHGNNLGKILKEPIIRTFEVFGKRRPDH